MAAETYATNEPDVFTSVEICAGAGGQAIGLEAAGFRHLACVEIDPNACSTLRANRPGWNVVETDVRTWRPSEDLRDVDLLAGGVPCPPFTVAGKQLGPDDERDLFPEMIRLAQEINPKMIMIENVRGILARKFDCYRTEIVKALSDLGYEFLGWELLNASHFGVPQARQRAILVMAKPEVAQFFSWPTPDGLFTTVGSVLAPLMAENGWQGHLEWAARAQGVAPALVGGSKKHGGADLGPTRAKNQWRELGVDGHGLADNPPSPDFEGDPRLTVKMAAAIQGFPSDWQIQGRKTAAYRQIGNAFPPPVARAVGSALQSALFAASLGTAA